MICADLSAKHHDEIYICEIFLVWNIYVKSLNMLENSKVNIKNMKGFVSIKSNTRGIEGGKVNWTRRYIRVRR